MENSSLPAADAVEPDESGSSWLNEWEVSMREKHPGVVQQLAEVGGIDENSSIVELTRRAKEHEEHLQKMHETQKHVNYIDHEKANLRLVRTRNKRSELVFPPYDQTVQVLKKFIHWNITDGIPEYDGIMVPEEYGKLCGEYVKQVMNSRYETVKYLLTRYHQYYIRKTISSYVSKIASNQITKALRCRGRQATIARQPQPVANAATGTASLTEASFPPPQPVMKTDGEAAQPSSMPSLMITSPMLIAEMRPRPQEQVSPMPLESPESLTPNLNKKKKIDECSEAPLIRIPSSISNSPDLPERVPMNVDIGGQPSNESPPSPIAPVLSQGIPSAPPHHPVNQQASSMNANHQQLLESVVKMVKEECPKDLEWMITFVLEGGDTNLFSQAIRACQMFIRLELEQKYKFQQHKNVVDAMLRWVLRFEKLSETRNVLSMLKQDMEGCGGNCHKSLKAALHRFVSKEAEKEKLAMQNRCKVILPLLSPEDCKGLENRVQRAKEDVSKDLLSWAQTEVIRELWERPSRDNHGIPQTLPPLRDDFRPQDVDEWKEFFSRFDGTTPGRRKY